MAKMFTPKEGGADGGEAPDTIIGKAVKLDGTFSGSGNVTVYGEIVGTLQTNGDLVVESSASVEANIEANNITVSGEVHGNIMCHGTLRLLTSAKVHGDVTTDIIEVETGAVIKGQCSTGNTSSAPVAQPKEEVQE